MEDILHIQHKEFWRCRRRPWLSVPGAEGCIGKLASLRLLQQSPADNLRAAKTWAASAFIEHFRYSAASPVPGSPEVEFGASSPNTNNAMRLLGAKGYEPWDTSLLAGGTEKFYDQGESTFVSYSPNYWFGAWFNG